MTAAWQRRELHEGEIELRAKRLFIVGIESPLLYVPDDADDFRHTPLPFRITRFPTGPDPKEFPREKVIITMTCDECSCPGP